MLRLRITQTDQSNWIEWIYMCTAARVALLRNQFNLIEDGETQAIN